MAEPNWTAAIQRARACAPFLARALDRQRDLEDLLAVGQAEEALKWARARGEIADTAIALRRERLALATTLAIGDLAGAFTLNRVMAELSGFADYALDRAIRTAIAERSGDETGAGFIALALGKQGASELNYSSDIDPILLYDPDRLARRASDDPGEVAQRYARRVLALLSENTGDGYVLRVDLRLRPAAEISPLVVREGTALTHYQGEALAWERAAFIRARAAAGDIAAGEAFLAEIAPFIWRQALDFGAIEEIRALTLRIRESHQGPRQPGPGFDLKRGRGGIREIEFFAQTHQLIHGGRDRSLRVRGTREALDALSAAGRISAQEAVQLGHAYDRLRMLEHRLQMVDDRQTHSLPDGAALDVVAQLDGLPSGAALVEELTALTAGTSALYDTLIEADRPARSSTALGGEYSEHAEPSTNKLTNPHEAMLTQLGFADPSRLAARIEEWRDGRYASIRSPQALEAFDRLLPVLLGAIAQSDDPARALTRWQSIIERAPSAIKLFRLLVAEPDVLERLVAALTLSPILADQLARRPEVLDVLIENKPVDYAGLRAAKAAQMRSEAKRDDYEAQLDCIRQVVSETRFTLGIELITAQRKPSVIGAGLSDLAEAAIEVAHSAAAQEFAVRHGQIDGGELVVLGLGRLGGGALTHASDLDMIYLFTGDFDTQSDGERSLGATLYFNRLATRVSAALSVPTASGALYEIDTRLRPQGNQGPLAVSLEAFGKYQRENAWTWEHMALNRACVLAASPRARADVHAIIDAVKRTPRDAAQLRDDVLNMRAEMARHKPPRGVLDVKLMRGGLVDVEFLVHFIQLREAAALGEGDHDVLSPDFAIAIPALARLGLIDDLVWPAYDLMTDILVAGRLLAPDGSEPPQAAAKALARACRCDHYDELMERLGAARVSIARSWTATFNQDLEL
ncbi:MAG: bifunctional [glutamate--ammonia ligase]-adenylyl-L-tyrosine phosphorylase/[glutamate--ammonia-ligase] adenylyltransferase [Erythrobacter sp.]|nr:bifunctional [glutamate--ammonia ligase]-adenylyl-L-tyrosine phosphorylase/[glutamate--ammonia-ligase] adenylyltransferase [Erythrobacter sp.]